jgi:hypothetical protein
MAFIRSSNLEPKLVRMRASDASAEDGAPATKKLYDVAAEFFAS